MSSKGQLKSQRCVQDSMICQQGHMQDLLWVYPHISVVGQLVGNKAYNQYVSTS